MPQGLQVWDASGNVVLNPDDRVGHVLGQVNTGTANGSVTGVTGFLVGEPFVFTLPLFDESPSSSRKYMFNTPDVTIVGTTVSWNFDGVSGDTKVPAIIYYGVY